MRAFPPPSRPLAVISGASSRIGFELARCCALDGHDVVVAADEDLTAAVQELQAPGARVTAVQADLASASGVDQIRADMTDTAVGRGSKDHPADVARAGYQAMKRGDGDVVTGWKNKVQVALAGVTPAAVKAAQHRRMAQPHEVR